MTATRPVSPAYITRLAPGQIMVFGSNAQGIHGAGAAKDAWLYFGAIRGQGDGLQGQSYGIPTRKFIPDTRGFVNLPLARIGQYVEFFLGYAKSVPYLTFLVTPIGCGRAGYSPSEIGPLFYAAGEPPMNIHLPAEFIP